MDEFGQALFETEAEAHAVFLKMISDRDCSAAVRWPTGALPSQLPPQGPWRTWLLMAGRGYGKTRAGAEWVHQLAMKDKAGLRIALVGASIADVRMVMIEGESGLLAIAPPDERPQWDVSLGRLTWPTGVQAHVFSGAHPNRLRGPQHHYAWCDEIVKWDYPDQTWQNLQLGLRLGAWPRTLITTTPRPMPLIRQLLQDPNVAVTHGKTIDNKALSDDYLAYIQQCYAGTRIGRQELDGELIEDVEGALWSRATIEACRVAQGPSMQRVVIAVDPAASSTGDLCGIVVAGLGCDGLAYVIEDISVGATPERWAKVVADAVERHMADRVIAEANNGGDMVKSVLRAADHKMPITLVHASRGKSARAEPIALLYEAGRVKHIGAFPALEDELCGLKIGGGYEGPSRSPDRADAAIWALSALMLGGRPFEPRVRVI